MKLIIVSMACLFVSTGCTYIAEAMLRSENEKKLRRGEIDYYEYSQTDKVLDEVGGMDLR